MFQLDRRSRWALFAALAVMMALTRSHHFASSYLLPDASGAAFFLGGLLLVRWGLVLPLFLVAALVDMLVIGWGGVSDFCVSLAYPFLLPAYAALWLGGRWLAQTRQIGWWLVPRVTAALLVAPLVCELIASGSFYFLSGVVADPNLLGFHATFWRYFPASLANFVIYLALAAPLIGWLYWKRAKDLSRPEALCS